MEYDLRHPVKGRDTSGNEVVVLERLPLRRPTAADTKALQPLTGANLTIATVARLSGIAKELVERIDAEDLAILDEITDAFFSFPAASDAAAAWLKSQGLADLRQPKLPATSAPSGGRSS